MTDAGLDDIAKVDFFCLGWVNICLLEGMLDGNGAKLWCGERLERSVERSNGRSGCSDDNSFVGGLGAVCHDTEKE